MALSSELLDILRCPESKKELIYFPEGEADHASPFLFCPASRLRYPVEQDIPVMLVDEAERLSRDDARRLVARARELGLGVPADADAAVQASSP